MNKRQKRLCRALLDFYDASGGQPYLLAQLARKVGYDAPDIYDKDSQSGDLWPFDAKARGTLAGMLSFTAGKNPTVSITPAGLVSLEKLCEEEPGTAATILLEKAIEPLKIAPVTQEVASVRREIASELPKSVPAPSPSFSAEEIAEARARFKDWLQSEQALKSVLGRLDGNELIEAAFETFFSAFLLSKES